MSEQKLSLVIETARLTLAIPPPMASSRVVDYLMRNKDHFAPTSPSRPEDYYTEDSWRARLSTAQDEFRKEAAIRLFLFARGALEGPVLGDVTFSNIVRGPFQACHLGYDLDHAHVGKGLMFEALQAAIRHVFEEMNLHRIMANYMPTNIRSGRLLRRLGFTPEGYARDYLLLGGAWQDHILTSLLRPSS